MNFIGYFNDPSEEDIVIPSERDEYDESIEMEEDEE